MAVWDLSRTKHHVLICNGGSCLKHGGEEVTLALRAEIERLHLDDYVHTTRTKCNGRCDDACVVIVYPDGVWYHSIGTEDVPALVQKHFIENDTLESKLSHWYENDSFVRSAGAVRGIMKSEKKG